MIIFFHDLLKLSDYNSPTLNQACPERANFFLASRRVSLMRWLYGTTLFAWLSLLFEEK